MLLPGESRLTTLLIYEAHRVNANFGIAAVLSHLRRRYWIIRGRQVAKGLLRRCVICRKRQARHVDQVEATLPKERVTFTAPFRATGLDFCGPFHVKSHEPNSKRDPASNR